MVNSRRRFMRNAMVAGTMATTGGLLGSPHVYAETEAVPPVEPLSNNGSMYDVVVVGAGTAGTIAAIQAGRLGMRTLLVEKNGMPGGTTTVAAVNFPGLFHAWGRQVIAGIGWELVSRTVEECGGTLPDFTTAPERHWQQQVRVNRAIYTALACEALQQAGVDTLFHTMLAQVVEREQAVAITLCTKTGLEQVAAKVLIDASGDAGAVFLAGYPLVEHASRQPGTLILTLAGYDVNALDQERVQKSFQQALESGALHPEDETFVRNNILGLLRSRGDNCTHITHVDGRTSAGRSLAEMNSRVSLLRVFRFLRQQPGLETLEIPFMAAECGVRETVTIRGQATITHDDYVSGRLWDDALCYSFYPIDLHYTQGGGIDTRPLRRDTFPSVPKAALAPEGSRRLLVAGRCLSSDREANSALRVQATCMACGQAAAVTAAHAIDEDTSVMEASVEAIRNTLAEHNAIVPGPEGPPVA